MQEGRPDLEVSRVGVARHAELYRRVRSRMSGALLATASPRAVTIEREEALLGIRPYGPSRSPANRHQCNTILAQL